jgi:protein phosphatase
MGLGQIIEIAALTDSGVKRTHNEDSIVIDPELGLAVVADGMGGYKGGEVASALAVNSIIGELKRLIDEYKASHPDGDIGLGPESMAVREVLKLANEIIHNTAQSQPQYQGMGTTVVLTLFYGGYVTIAHIGDARLYRLRNDELERVTVDHTLLQELVARGFYTREEAQESQNKNLVTRALGIDPEVEADIQEDIALPGDIYLLCSDGLNDMVDDRDIHLTLKRYNDNLERAAAELIKQANDNGGKDNVSVILVRPTKASSAEKGWVDKIVDWFF